MIEHAGRGGTPERPGEGREQLRRRRGRIAVLALGWLISLAVIFFAGLAVGRAVEDTPEPGGTQTLVRTLEPATVQPEPRTVTVTVTSP